MCRSDPADIRLQQMGHRSKSSPLRDTMALLGVTVQPIDRRVNRGDGVDGPFSLKNGLPTPSPRSTLSGSSDELLCINRIKKSCSMLLIIVIKQLICRLKGLLADLRKLSAPCLGSLVIAGRNGGLKILHELNIITCKG